MSSHAQPHAPGETDILLNSPSQESFDEEYPAQDTPINPFNPPPPMDSLDLGSLFNLFNGKRIEAEDNTSEYLHWHNMFTSFPGSLEPADPDQPDGVTVAEIRRKIYRDRAISYLHAMETLLAYIKNLRGSLLNRPIHPAPPSNATKAIPPVVAAWTTGWTVTALTVHTTIVTGISILSAAAGAVALTLTGPSAWQTYRQYNQDRQFEDICTLVRQIRHVFEDDPDAINESTAEILKDESRFAFLEAEIERLAEASPSSGAGDD